ncbi:hypothetical protein [Paenibacillus polymyxa]|uniref:hypothetical protein n=2 Tax=Paenibacillus polymyxa TaxID=1406 RepID=UPI001CA4BEB8|nr:hypothetical protein [Paenibacillus polymyxa]MDN4102525.1 hypothetical protein [Paenibacillus polymyxa]
MTSIFAMFWDMLFYVTINAYELYYTGEVGQSKGYEGESFNSGGGLSAIIPFAPLVPANPN